MQQTVVTYWCGLNLFSRMVKANFLNLSPRGRDKRLGSEKKSVMRHGVVTPFLRVVELLLPTSSWRWRWGELFLTKWEYRGCWVSTPTLIGYSTDRLQTNNFWTNYFRGLTSLVPLVIDLLSYSRLDSSLMKNIEDCGNSSFFRH